MSIESKKKMDTYYRRKSKGLCVKCGKAPATKSRTKCGPCQEHHRKLSREYKAKHRIKAAKEGLCTNCMRPALAGKKKCQRCIDIHNQWMRKHNQEADRAGHCRRCDAPALKGFTKCETHRKEEIRHFVKRRRELKRQVIKAYGGRCVCCGIDHLSALNIDHIENNGADHRRQIGMGNLYNWLKKESFPTGFQVLCANCNTSKAVDGRCTIPH